MIPVQIAIREESGTTSNRWPTALPSTLLRVLQRNAMHILFIELACRRLLVPQKIHGEESANILGCDGVGKKMLEFPHGCDCCPLYAGRPVPASIRLAIACGRLQHSADRANLYRGRV